MPCHGYIAAEDRRSTAEKRSAKYGLVQNKHLWAKATERQRNLIIHEARTTMDESNEIMSRHRLGCPVCKVDGDSPKQ